VDEFDVLVIGAGHQGLVAATVLAEAGLSTAVVESDAEIGGAVRSAEVTSPGFVHDLYATNMNLFLGSPFFARYGEEMASDGLRFARSAHPYASAFPDGSSLRVSSDEQATLSMWREHSAQDAAGWERLRVVFECLADVYLPLYSNRQPSWRAVTAVVRAAHRHRRDVAFGELAAVLLSTTRSLGERYFATPEAKSLAAAWGMHLDYAPDVAGGAVFPLLEMYVDMLNGMSLVEGGAGRLPHAISTMLRRRGGTVVTGVPVTRVDVDTTGARGVTLADGRRLRARRGIISTVVLPHLVHDLLAGATVPAMMRSAADAYRFGPGTFMLHLALDGPLPWRDERLSRFAYVHIGSYIDDMARTYQQALAHHLPDTPLVIVGQTSVVDPTRVTDPGKYVVWIQVRAVPGRVEADALGRIGGTSWSDIREAFADRIMDILEAHAPGLKNVVNARVAVSPEDLQQADSNLVGGDSGAGSHHLDQFLMLRPSFALSRYRTSVPRLYLAGAGTWPGAGVNAVSGQRAAEALLHGSRTPSGLLGSLRARPRP
jgi:phytoene dehydrogenase-like protein